jgi:hypothetical protein
MLTKKIMCSKIKYLGSDIIDVDIPDLMRRSIGKTQQVSATVIHYGVCGISENFTFSRASISVKSESDRGSKIQNCNT